MGEFVVFDKLTANMLIKRGFPLREIGGKINTIYYFDDTPAVLEAYQEIQNTPMFYDQETGELRSRKSIFCAPKI